MILNRHGKTHFKINQFVGSQTGGWPLVQSSGQEQGRQRVNAEFRGTERGGAGEANGVGLVPSHRGSSVTNQLLMIKLPESLTLRHCCTVAQ